MQYLYKANGKWHTAPVLPAFEFNCPDHGPIWLIWCSSCEIIHTHRATEGHHVAQCGSKNSAYEISGYVLKYSGNVENRDDVRPGNVLLEWLNVSGMSDVLEMRVALLRSWMPGGDHVVGMIKGAGDFYGEVGLASVLSLDLDTMAWEYVDGEVDPFDGDISTGHGLDTLASKLFGIPPDEIRLRLGRLICGGPGQGIPVGQQSTSSSSGEADYGK